MSIDEGTGAPDPSTALLAALLELAVGVAREAGALLMEGWTGDLRVETKTSPTDPVTAMDRAAERLILDRVRAARPNDAILGEEGADDSGTTGVRWVVDPLDGTVNYLYRLPAWAVSIGVEVDGQVVAGVVHAPAWATTYTATLGGGAFENGAGPIACSIETSLAQSLVATGFGYDAGRRGAQAAVLAGLLPRIRDVRRFGAAALDLCLVAAGRIDAYYERGLQPWDLAAGALVAREAGCIVGGLAGRPASGELVIAAPPALFGPLAGALAVLGADRG